MEIPLPRRCAEAFELGEPIAVGGFGAVYRATQKRFGRPVALKLLRPDAFGRDGALVRFRAEARVTASLHHPHIVKVLDADVDEDTPWIAYELIEGDNLRARMNGGRTPWPLAARLMSQVASALAAAHEQGILHRDVKPENILEAPAGFARVTDFGIAYWRDSGVNTQAGILIGTPNYISPEMAVGQPATPAYDIYAVGIMLYELLVGRRPFIAYSVPGMLDAHVKSPVPPIEGEILEIPAPLCDLTLRLLAKKPGDRPASAEALARELDSLLAPLTVVTGAVLVRKPPAESAALEAAPAIPAPPPKRATRRAPRSHGPRTAALAVVVSLAVATAFVLVAFRPRADPLPVPVPPPEIAMLSEARIASAFAALTAEEAAHLATNAEYSSVRDLTMSSTRAAHVKAAQVARAQAALVRARLDGLDRLAGELGTPPPEPREGVAARVLRAQLAVWRAFLTLRLDRVQQRARMADRSLSENLDTVGDIPRLMELELTIEYEVSSLRPLQAAFGALARAAPHLASSAVAPPEAGTLFEQVLRLGDQMNPYRFRAPFHAEYANLVADWERELDRGDPTRGFRPGRLVADLFQIGATGTVKRVPVAYARALDALDLARRALPNAITGLTLTEASLRRYAY